MQTWTRGTLSLLVCALATTPALAAESTFDKHFDAPPGGRLTVETDLGAIVVVGREAREVVVHADLNGSDDFIARMQISAVQGSDGVTVTGRGRENYRSWFDWLFDFDRNRVVYTIAVPRDYPIDLRTAGGSLDVQHLNASVRGATSGGSITLRDVHGPIDAHTSGGHIEAVDLQGPAQLRSSGGRIEVADATGDLDLHTSGGSIHLQRIDGKVQAQTSGGAVEAQILSNRSVSLVTSGGSITLVLPAKVRGSIDAHTSGGHVESAVPMTSTEIASRTELRGSINGGGEPIFLRTSGGSIHIGTLD